MLFQPPLPPEYAQLSQEELCTGIGKAKKAVGWEVARRNPVERQCGFS